MSIRQALTKRKSEPASTKDSQKKGVDKLTTGPFDEEFAPPQACRADCPYQVPLLAYSTRTISLNFASIGHDSTEQPVVKYRVVYPRINFTRTDEPTVSVRVTHLGIHNHSPKIFRSCANLYCKINDNLNTDVRTDQDGTSPHPILFRTSQTKNPNDHRTE